MKKHFPIYQPINALGDRKISDTMTEHQVTVTLEDARNVLDKFLDAIYQFKEKTNTRIKYLVVSPYDALRFKAHQMFILENADIERDNNFWQTSKDFQEGKMFIDDTEIIVGDLPNHFMPIVIVEHRDTSKIYYYQNKSKLEED